jgi:hypothetical protein
MTNDLDHLKSRLADRAEDLCVELFGKPTSRTHREWRWGRRGSAKLDLMRTTTVLRSDRHP